MKEVPLCPTFLIISHVCRPHGKAIHQEPQMIYLSNHRVPMLMSACSFAFDSCNTMDCSTPGSTVHGIFQTRILEWVAISYFRGSSQPRDGNGVSASLALEGRLFITEPGGKPLSNRVCACAQPLSRV